MRRRKIVSLLFFMLVIAGSILIIPKEYNVEATTGGGSGGNGLVGLDYQEIFNKTVNLTEIVINVPDNGLYKGRWFGSKGEREAACKIKGWMENYTDDLAQITNVSIKQESITLNKCVNVLEYGLKLYNENHTVIIPNNESFPFPCWFFGKQKNISHFNVEVLNFSKDMLPDKTEFNISYIRLNNSNYGFFGEVVYIENYSNVSENETFDKIHLINVSNNEYNDTVELIANLNASGFILMRDNVSDISSWETSISGVAISKENASIIKELATNESKYLVLGQDICPFCCYHMMFMITSKGWTYVYLSWRTLSEEGTHSTITR